MDFIRIPTVKLAMQSLSNRFILPLFVLTLPSSFAVAAEELDRTVVTATRVEQAVDEVGYSVNVLTEQDFENRALRTVPEALRYQSGVLVQKTTHGHGSPFIRGFTGRQNLLLVDGVRVNNSTYRSGPIQYWNTLDADAVKRMELVKGPGSVLYGSDSLGGTLNVLSKDTGYLEHERSFSNGSASYKYDTSSGSHVGRLQQSIGEGGKWGASFGISQKDYGDIRDSNLGVMKNTGYREEDYDFKFQYALSDKARLTFAHQYVNQDDVWRWHSTVFNQGWTHDNHRTDPGSLAYRIYDQERSLTYFKLEGESDNAFLENWQATLSYQKSQDSEVRDKPDNSDFRQAVADVDTYGLTFQGSGYVADGTLVWGFDYYHDEVDTDASSPRRRPVADDSSYDTLGLFAQYQWDVSDKLSLSAGARASYFQADWGKAFNRDLGVDESGDGDWSDLSFNLRSVYQVNDSYSIFGGISQGFRAPNLDDLTGSTVANAGDEVVGGADIDPEKVISFELGNRWDNDSLSVSTSVYYTHIDEPITRGKDTSGPTDVFRIINGDEGYLYGAEIDAFWQINEQWSARANATFQDGKEKRFDDGQFVDDTIRRLSPISGSVSIKWTHPSERFWVEGVVLAAATQNNLQSRVAADDNDNQRIPAAGTPGYLVAHLNAGYQATDNLDLTFGLENITDEDYRVHGSGVNESGINGRFGAKLTW